MMRSLQLPLSRYSNTTLLSFKQLFVRASILSTSCTTASSFLLTSDESVRGYLAERQASTPFFMCQSIIFISVALSGCFLLSNTMFLKMFSEQYIFACSKLISPLEKEWKAEEETVFTTLEIHSLMECIDIFPSMTDGASINTYLSLASTQYDSFGFNSGVLVLEFVVANPLRTAMSSLNSDERAFCYVSAEFGLLSDDASTLWGFLIRLRTLNILCFIVKSVSKNNMRNKKIQIKQAILKLTTYSHITNYLINSVIKQLLLSWFSLFSKSCQVDIYLLHFYLLLMNRKTFNLRSVFRIAQTIPNTPRQVVENQPVRRDVEDKGNFTQFMTMFTDLVQNKLGKTSNPRFQYQIEARDREVFVDLPPVTNGSISEKDLKRWISDVVKTVCSSAFNSYSKSEMTFEQAKIYCSENILKNIVTLGQKYQINETEMEMMDKHIKNGVLTYLAAKYPLTESIAVNKRLEQAVRGVDVIDSVQNNYFSNSKVVFEYRDSGNYNDLIMRLLNEIISKVNEGSNFQDFKKLMSKVFESVESQDWMNKKGEQQVSDLKESNEKKEEYRAKVKEYTQYLIGRKINENTPYFTEEEIQNGNIEIKNPQILRILTKWCEQLEQKYQQNYFKNFNESFKEQKGDKIHKISLKFLTRLDNFIEREFQGIEKFMVDVFKNNYEMQANILQRELQLDGDEHIDSKEKISGKLSAKIVQNIYQYTITYLNKLIHGILESAKQISFGQLHFKYNLEYPLNLLSFKIGDLMRCKCSSKEKEILRIYEEINRINKESPEILKIVRIKNRLRSETNDILLNVRFNNAILCQIQLAIHSKSTSFVQCSNKFHHYLYQLQRSLFGPLTELCNIWNSLDRRTALYQELISQEQNLVGKEVESQCKMKGNSHIFNNFERSFICSKCRLTICHNNFSHAHQKCNRCPYFLCAKCILKSKATNYPKTLLEQELSPLYVKTINDKDNLPTYGACIKISQKSNKPLVFKLTQYQGTEYLFGLVNKKIYEIHKINSKKQKQIFRKQYVIFELNQSQALNNINDESVQQYILASNAKDNFKKEKEIIKLDGLRLTTQQAKEILSVGSHVQRQKTKAIVLADNDIKNVSFASKQFSSMEQLNISSNPLQSIEGIDSFVNLKHLELKDCHLNVLSPSLFNCLELRTLLLANNCIKKIDDNISNLKKLEILAIQTNQLEKIPEALYECRQLKELNFSYNPITQFSENLGKLEKLEKLILWQNRLKSLPESMGNLQNLKQLSLGQNRRLASLPKSLQKLKKIEKISLIRTDVSQISINQQGWKNLSQIETQFTKIALMPKNLSKSTNLRRVVFNPGVKEVFFENLPEINLLVSEESNIIGCPNWMYSMKNASALNLAHNKISNIKQVFLDSRLLQILDLSNNEITQFPNLSNCSKLYTLNFSNNSITSIPSQCFLKHDSLFQFYCSNNLLTYLPHTILTACKISQLNLENNRLTSLLPPQYQDAPFRNLKQVNLNNNLLEDIPLNICIPLLRKAQLDHNKLTKIRPEIGQCSKLQYLSLNSNLIEEIDPNIAKLKNLSELYMKDNNITVIPSFLPSLRSLKSFIVSTEKIKSIQCAQWVISSTSVQFGDLAKLASTKN